MCHGEHALANLFYTISEKRGTVNGGLGNVLPLAKPTGDRGKRRRSTGIRRMGLSDHEVRLRIMVVSAPALEPLGRSGPGS